MAAEWRNPCAVISPTPRALQAARSRKLNARLENGAPEYPGKHKLRRHEGDSAGSHDPAAFNFLLEGLPLEERCTQASGNGHILENALDPESDDFLPHPPAIGPSELDQLLEPAGRLEESVGQVKREGGAVALLVDFEVVEERTSILSKTFGHEIPAFNALVLAVTMSAQYRHR